ncbi:MAG: lycopene cyclase domain-containing protein [Schleiferiaceae bacterium]|nr:lycopene cyclase domain-containing protein [Schleiferiaceae bacterium]
MGSRLYLIIDLLIFLGPLTRAFEPRIYYIGKWKRLLGATLIVMALFIPWDIAFTHQGVWGFTDRYLIPWDFFGLPLEEILFFVVVPWACYFIFEVLQLFFPWKTTHRMTYLLTLVAGLALIAFALRHAQQSYTFWTFLLLAASFGLVYVWKPWWLAAFLRSWALAMLPFLVVNGILTGSGLEEPIVWYDNLQNLGIRIGSIPIEDAFYGMLMMLIYTAVMQWKKNPKSFT